VIQFGAEIHLPTVCKGQVGNEFTYAATITPTRDPAIQEVQVNLARIDSNMCEKVVLLLAGPVERTRTTLPQEIETLIRGTENQSGTVDEVVDRVTAWAKAEQIRPHATVREFSSTSVPLDELVQGLDFTTPQNPIDVKDRLTQFRGKSAFNSHEAMAKLNETISGEKLLFGFDVRGVGEANRVGLGKEAVDTFFSHLGTIAKESLGSLNHEVIRLGGDEFAIVLQDRGDESIAAVKRFNASAMQLRDKLLVIDDPRVQDAELRLAIRGKMRALFSENYTLEVTSREDYIEKLLLTVPLAHQAELREKAATPDGHIDSGKLTLMIATQGLDIEKETEACDRRVLDFVGAIVKIGMNPDSEFMSEALATIDKITHNLKERPQSSADELHELDPQVHIRAATRRSIQAVDEVSKEFEASLQDLSKKQSFSGLDGIHAIIKQNNMNATDPEIGYENKVLRLGLVHDFTIGQILPVSFPCHYDCFEVRLEPFGPLNNQLGSDRADDIYRAMAREIREMYPDAVLIRRNGGNLVVLTPQAEDFRNLQDFEQKINNVMTSASGNRYQRAVAEHEQRQALRGYFEASDKIATPTKPFEIAEDIRSAYQRLPIRMELVSTPVKVQLESRQTFGQLIQSLFP